MHADGTSLRLMQPGSDYVKEYDNDRLDPHAWFKGIGQPVEIDGISA